MGPVDTRVNFCGYDVVFVPGNMLHALNLSCVPILIPVINYWFSVHKIVLLQYYVRKMQNIKTVLYTQRSTERWYKYKNSFLLNMSYHMDSHPKIGSCPLLGTMLINFLIKTHYRKAYITGMNFYETQYRPNYFLQKLAKCHCLANDKILTANNVCPRSNIESDYAPLCQWFNKSFVDVHKYSDIRYYKRDCFINDRGQSPL